MDDLASTIAAGRRAAGLTQAQLARRVGISASYLSRIEAGAWRRGGPWPADSVLCALARDLGLSSTELIACRRRERAGAGTESDQPGALARANGRAPYSVSVGADEVDAAARRLIERNPRRGTLRSVQVFSLPETASGETGTAATYLDALAGRLADDGTVLYRVCASTRRHLDLVRSTLGRVGGTNVRTRFAFANPLALDVLIGDHEVLIGLPDGRGHPALGACVVVEDPDFVDAARRWFDESVWEPSGGCVDVAPESIEEAFQDIESRLMS